MDNLQSRIGRRGHTDDDGGGPDLPPLRIGQDERRLQVRAYNYWTRLLGDRQFPAIADIDFAHLPDFATHGVLIDFRHGMADPAIGHLGIALAAECGAPAGLRTLAEVPGRSLLSRITEHHREILARQAPIGFAAEFENAHGAWVLYRGILLPFSSDGTQIDHIFGVISWCELAHVDIADQLRAQLGGA